MLNEILKLLREKNRYSQIAVANYLHITRQAYNHYETGRNVPPLEIIKKLADFYNVSVDIFLSSDTEINNKQTYIENESSKQINEKEKYQINDVIKNTLTKLRVENKCSQTEIADYLHITRQAYNHYETGKRIPTLETIKKLANFYNVPADIFLSNDNKVNNKLDCTDNKIIGNRISELRKENQVTQVQLAKMLGVSQQTISKYENGSREPDNATLLKLSKMFNVTIDYLLENSIEKCQEIKEKDPHNNPNYAGDEIYKKLVEIGFLKEGEVITDKHLEVLAEILAPQVEFSRFKLNQKQ